MTSDEYPERRREYTWSDPAPIADAAPSTSGMEFLQRMVDGEIPQAPVASTLSFALVEASVGTATILAQPHEFGYNAIGTVHGGVIATWADTAIGYAVQSHLPAGSSITTLDLQVRYLRPIRVETGPVTITATTDHAGRRTGTARATISDADGRLLATATSTCLVVPA
ncbi:thioesterase [Frondihabitans sucicola]|uniref:Thioesterase n=1 Tax=Frondihabitans sucicola TaxID=1268041 RepID=A0ABM8GJI8_9MICO|nr:PaaI family thioesterase [Frondihabitans sucicola]BDZ48330.1 thioesterase [Frondihabitans sucicola]